MKQWKILSLFVLVTIAVLLRSPTSVSPQPTYTQTWVGEEDGNPSVVAYMVKVTNGTLTDNADGTVSLVTGGGMTSFISEDGDGTEVSISNAEEWKFVEGTGIDIDWTDTSTGSDADPFDLTFTVDLLLNELGNPDGNKTFNMTTRELGFLWTNPSGHPLDLEASGAYSGSLLHLHQHTGNPDGTAHLLEMEASDLDVMHMQSSAAATTTMVYCVQVTGDTADKWRWHLFGDGLMEWGDGTNGEDTNLYRNAANELKTDDSFTSAATIEGATLTEGGIAVINATEGGAWTGTHNFGGATAIEVENVAGDVTLTNNGEVGIDTAQNQLAVYSGAEKVLPLNHIGQGTFDLAAQYDVDTDLWLFDLHADTYPDGIVITSWHVDCTLADPTTELDANLMYCDAVAGAAFPGANPVLIDVINTTTGNSTEGTMGSSDLGSGVIPTGKSLYIDMDADPADADTQYHVRIHFYIPES